MRRGRPGAIRFGRPSRLSFFGTDPASSSVAGILRFLRWIPILQGRDGGVFIIEGNPDQRSAQQQKGRQEKPVTVGIGIGIDRAQEKIYEEWRREAERAHGDTFDQEETILHEPKILASGIDGKQENLSFVRDR